MPDAHLPLAASLNDRLILPSVRAMLERPRIGRPIWVDERAAHNSRFSLRSNLAEGHLARIRPTRSAAQAWLAGVPVWIERREAVPSARSARMSGFAR